MIELVVFIGFGYLVGNNDERRIFFTEKQKIITRAEVIETTTPTTPNFVNNKTECDTEITEIFYSKASGEITICKGKLLEVGQKTRIRRVSR